MLLLCPQRVPCQLPTNACRAANAMKACQIPNLDCPLLTRRGYVLRKNDIQRPPDHCREENPSQQYTEKNKARYANLFSLLENSNSVQRESCTIQDEPQIETDSHAK